MGFSGGGANILKPHTHDSNILQDGGNLDFDNITQSDMAAGSTTYSNGSHLQELVKPVTPANEVLTFATAASAPSWASAATGGFLELLDVHTATGTETSYTLTQAFDFDDYSNFILIFQGANTDTLELQLQVNGATSAYHYTTEYCDGTSIAFSVTEGASLFPISSTNLGGSGGSSVYAMVELYMNDTDEKYLLGRSYSHGYQFVSKWETRELCNSAIGTGDISVIKWLVDTSSWTAGTRISTYGYKMAR